MVEMGVYTSCQWALRSSCDRTGSICEQIAIFVQNKGTLQVFG